MESNPILSGKKSIKLYFGKGIILDTKPLIFFLAGNYDFDSIGKTPLTKEYTKEDFELLMSFVSKFKKIIVTPQILAEMSNIINKEISETDFANFIEKIIKILFDCDEIYIQKNDILKRDELKKVGITDTSILLSCERDDLLVLTKDLPFALICSSRGLPVIHFDLLRGLNWFS